MHDVKMIRNVALFGQSKSGKTTLGEALLFTAGKTKRLGKVDEGTSVLDFEPEEAARKLSISTSFNQFPWQKYTVFLMDTPGDENFANEAYSTARVADSAILTIAADIGVKYHTERIADVLKENNLPTLIVVTKLDKERTNFEATCDAIKGALPFSTVPIHLPIGTESNFKGIVDIVQQKAFLFEGTTGKVKDIPIPGEMADAVATARDLLMERVAETDDELIEKFLEEGVLTDEELGIGLTSGILNGKLCPICAAASAGNLGTEPILNVLTSFMPSPVDKPAWTGTVPKNNEATSRKALAEAPFSALVFKTTADPFAGRLTIFKVLSGTLEGDSFYNATKDVTERFNQLLVLEGKEQKPVDKAIPGMVVALPKLKETTTGDTICSIKDPILYTPFKPIEPVMSYAVSPAKKDDDDKLFSSIGKMLEEDPTLRLTRDTEVNQTLLSGVGQVHLQVLADKIKRKYGVEMTLKPPKVAYRETIKGKAKAQGRHKKQSGGRGQFGDCWIEIEPLKRGEGFVYEDKIFGGAIPRQYIPAVEKGIVECMAGGVIAGYPMVDVKVALIDGSYHNVDSSELAFKIAGSLAFKSAVSQANPVLLEPIMEITIRIPKDCVGDIIGDLNSRRGKVMGMDSERKLEVITAQVPAAEILEYAVDLTSITGARGSFSMHFSHYEEVPGHLADKVIESAKAANA